MKKITFSLLGIFALLNPCFSQQQLQFWEIKSENDWNMALQKGRETGKLLFMDIYAEWCDWCKALEERTYSDPDFIQFYNQSFINVKVDEDTPVGQDISSRYLVAGLPTLLFINQSGESIRSIGGFKEPEELTALGRRLVLYLPKMDEFRSKEASGRLSLSETRAYSQALSALGREEEAEKLATRYFAQLNWTDIASWDDFSFFTEQAAFRGHPLYEKVLNHRETLLNRFGREEVTAFFDQALSDEMMASINLKSPEKMESVLKEVFPLSSFAEEFNGAEHLRIAFFKYTDADKYIQLLAQLSTPQNLEADSEFIQSELAFILSNIESSKHLEQAREVANRLYATRKEFKNGVLLIMALANTGQKGKVDSLLREVQGLAKSEEEQEMMMALWEYINGN